jgi:hypothetical protein
VRSWPWLHCIFTGPVCQKSLRLATQILQVQVTWCILGFNQQRTHLGHSTFAVPTGHAAGGTMNATCAVCHLHCSGTHCACRPSQLLLLFPYVSTSLSWPLKHLSDAVRERLSPYDRANTVTFREGKAEEGLSGLLMCFKASMQACVALQRLGVSSLLQLQWQCMALRESGRMLLWDTEAVSSHSCWVRAANGQGSLPLQAS